MDEERWRQIERLYEAALAHPPPDRSRFLDESCGADAALRRELERLLTEPATAEVPLKRLFNSSATQPGMTGPPLASGRRLGKYEVEERIGAGGMGEVYRARDTRLGRDVAIKVLPPTFATDPASLSRFEREARLLAALNHPNIATIHEVEELDGVRVLVMELVEGQTLAHRTTRGPIPVDEAIRIATQIAGAVEAAHEHGIVHRDLKPANIKLRPDGTVKVLDFGLAKSIEPLSALSVSMSESAMPAPTMVTGPGTVLGTPAYMSPEQARGKAVDARTDIWAFGAVLYEMLTGQRAFAGEGVAETLAAVFTAEPDWEALPDDVPAAVSVFLRQCLTKNVRQRVQHIGDMRLALEGAFESLASPALPGSTPPVASRRLLAVGVAIAVAAMVVLGFAAGRTWPRAEPPAVTRFHYSLPDGHALRNTGRPVMAFSPDGRHFVYNTSEGLYLRSMDDLEARLIRGTEAALTNPFFSPDGEAVAYFQDGALKRIDIDGGVPVVICAAGNAFGATWAPDNTILFGQSDGVMRVSADGGIPELVIKAGNGEQVHGPQLMPDGSSVLFSATTATGATRWDQGQVVVQSLRTGERTIVVRGGSDARYLATGHLLYAVGDGLFAVGFSERRLEVEGEPVPVVRGAMRVGLPATNTATANYGVSDNGTLVYVTSATAAPLLAGTLVWVDRNGKAQRVSDRQAPYRGPSLSPDGARVAVAMRIPDGNEDIWIVDVERGTHTRLTSDLAVDRYPVWTPDGRRIAFASNRQGRNGVYWTAADGTGVAEVLATGTTLLKPTSFLPGSTTLAFNEGDGAGGGASDIFSVIPGATPVRHSDTGFREQGAVFSPDGRWLAYTSDETQRPEVYAVPYARTGGKVAISVGGGHSARWSPDGRELFYRQGRQMMVATMESGPMLRVGTPRMLFEGDYMSDPSDAFAHNYDVSPDGQRFLMVAPAADDAGEQPRPSIVIVQGWSEELKRLAPAGR